MEGKSLMHYRGGLKDGDVVVLCKRARHLHSADMFVSGSGTDSSLLMLFLVGILIEKLFHRSPRRNIYTRVASMHKLTMNYRD